MTSMVELPHKDVPPPLELVKTRIEEILPPDAREQIDAGDVLVVDVRNPERFEAGHLPGAVNVSSGESARESREAAYAKAIEAAGAERSSRVILYCGEGNRSARTADALANEHGFENVASVIGGVKLWNDLGFPVEGEIVIATDDVESSETMGADTT